MADVGIGIIGREVTANVGGSVVVGVNSKGFTFNNELLDTTDDNSSGWSERMAIPGLKSIEFTMSGITKNLELINTFFAASQILPVVVDYPDGSQLSFSVAMGSLSDTGESNSLHTFDVSFESTGVPTWTPGV